MRARRRLSPPSALAIVLAAVLAAACSPGPTSAPTSSPQASPNGASPSPATSSAPAASSEPPVASARWSDCGRGFQCATVKVPLDYATASGVMNLSLVRMAATDRAHRIGALLVNPGGPGGSGVEFVREGLRFFPSSLRRRFDIVGFDPRGVNLSTGIRCIENLDPHAALDPSPDSPAEIAELVADAKEYAAACERNNAKLLAHLSTDDVVRDLEQIRRALGEPKLTYLGFSYGTLIGALYADRYPDRVRAMALDGAIDPRSTLEQLRTAQAASFEGLLRDFLADCARRSTCLLGRGAAATRNFDALMRSIDAHPLPALRIRDSRRVGPGLAWSAILSAMYSRGSWSTLESALGLARAGDGSLLLLMADPFRGRKPNGSYSNMLDAYIANTCVDFPARTDVASYTALAGRLQASAPHFAAQLAYNDLTCAFWAVPPVRVPGPVSATGAPPIVVIGTTHDPATPMGFATALARELDGGVLVTHRGEGHTAWASSPCVQRLVIDYLVTVKPPKAGVTCD